MSINISKSDVKWSYFSLILFNGINLLLLPFILAYLTSPEVGLWYTFTAVSSLVILLDLGFMTTLSRNVTYIWEGAEEITSSSFQELSVEDKRPNYELFVKLFRTTKIIYLFLGLTIFIGLLTIGSYYIKQISVSELPLKNTLSAWIIYSTAVFLHMKYAYWNPILKGIGAVKQNQQILIFTKLTQLLFTVIFLMLGFGLVGVSIAYLTSIAVNRILANIMFYSYQNNKNYIKPLLKKKMHRLEYVNIFKRLLPNTYKQALVSISNYINLRSTTLLSSAFLSLSTTAALGFTLQVLSLTTVVGNTFFNTFLPQFNSYRLKQKYRLLKRTFKKALVINYSIISISFLAFFIIAEKLLEVINSNVESLHWSYTLAIMFYIFLYNNHTVFATFIATKNVLPHYRAFIISSLVILIIQFSLLYNFEANLWHLILPICIVQLLYNNWKWPLLVIKELNEIK
ncbi:O-unit flippase-like protein [uncultured Marinococcus sp.]|uniref:O-unit flippase-like protein n=1 Tax=uncultured Marinococcus sp. TaxID=487012 RepID=UPI00261679AA|nr:O-unit flippase-like protein [uncultured Marinococcus sp.]